MVVAGVGPGEYEDNGGGDADAATEHADEGGEPGGPEGGGEAGGGPPVEGEAGLHQPEPRVPAHLRGQGGWAGLGGSPL